MKRNCCSIVELKRDLGDSEPELRSLLDLLFPYEVGEPSCKVKGDAICVLEEDRSRSILVPIPNRLRGLIPALGALRTVRRRWRREQMGERGAP